MFYAMYRNSASFRKGFAYSYFTILKWFKNIYFVGYNLVFIL